MDPVRDIDDSRVVRQAFAILAGDRPTGPTREQEIEDLVATWTTRTSSAD